MTEGPAVVSTSAHGLEVARTREVDGLGGFISSRYAPARVTSERGGEFRARHRARTVAGVYISEVAANRHEIDRDPRLVSAGDRKLIKVCVQLDGVTSIRQNNRVAELLPGDLAIEDLAAPYAMSLDDRFRAMFLLIEPSMLGIGDRSLRDLCAARIPGDEGVAAIVSPHLRALAHRLDLLDGPEGVRLVNSTVDLVGTVLHSMLGTAPADGPSRRRRRLLDGVQAYIDEHLGELGLGPAEIAAASFVSVRHLHGLFQQEGTTVAGWIRERRLERCRRDLADPLLRHRPVLDVASRWGLPDASHFSRMFKTRYGVSPTEYRLTPGVLRTPGREDAAGP